MFCEWEIPIDPFKRNLIETSQAYADQNLFDQALKLLEPINCVLGSWQKGRIYLQAANSMRDSWMFKNYPSSELKERYNHLLDAAYGYFDKTSILLPGADERTRTFLNQHLWGQISTVENLMVQVKPAPILSEEFIIMEDIVPNAENLIDDISDWTL